MMLESESGTYFGVIDIGSNSVRLVVYSGRERVANTVFNEKILCGLGAEVGETGQMGDKAVNMAKAALKRYRALCDQMGVTQIEAVATAAVRDASNGAEFARWIQTECDFPLRVIPGDEEARLAGLGVISADPTSKGLVGDLGGGSLELARIADHQVLETVSLPIGPLRLKSQHGADLAGMRTHVREALSSIPWLENADDPTFYIVGGSWRNLAKLMMWTTKVPLPVLQSFNVETGLLKDYATDLSMMAPDQIPSGRKLSSRRLEILPISALILSEVLEACGPERSAVSTYGLREGLIFESLNADEKAQDPYLYQCEDIAQERCRFTEHANLLLDWTRPLFQETALVSREKADRLHKAVCLLSDVAWRGHPDFRAERAVELALHGQFVGISHKGRAFVALALNQIYGASADRAQIKQVLPLLTSREALEARVLGASIRLAQRLSGGAVPGLDASRLSREEGYVVLTIQEGQSDLVNEVVFKRLKALATLLECRPKTETARTLSRLTAA